MVTDASRNIPGSCKPLLLGQAWMACLGAEEVVQEGGHDDGRLLLGDADVPAQLLRTVHPTRSPVPACMRATMMLQPRVWGLSQKGGNSSRSWHGWALARQYTQQHKGPVARGHTLC